MRQPDELPILAALRFRVQGRVQGVGFRPFVYRLAHEFGLSGWVQNRSGEVEIQIQGDPALLAAFQQALIQQAPPLARPQLGPVEPICLQDFNGFSIQPSATDAVPDIHVPPDCFTCDDCLAELRDPQARRYRYPFINCTQCGPRYTLIRTLPYDRSNTTLAGFPLCEDCHSEYHDPLDRRFHAQPLACPVCGPQVAFHQDEQIIRGETALAACSAALRAGQIVAVKGVGGYHLLCDATNAASVQRLREHKRRPDKPLAVMFPQRGADGLEALRTRVDLDATAAHWLRDPMRPIVLVRKRPDADLAPELAPGLQELGVFLPYSPLHHLLLDDVGGPLVATSGNISGEPVITDTAQAQSRLGTMVDAFLHHNRPIERPADDPVYRVIAGQPRPLRLGRGSAPLELTLDRPLREPVLALGGHLKVTVALAWENRVVISPHVGDLDSPRGLAVFQQVCADLQRLYGVTAHKLICDAHPGYAGTRWAERQALPVVKVFHHHAHAAALAGEHPEVKRWLLFTWDGVGYGPDGTLWGGEALWGQPGGWQRVASLRPFRLPGGDKAGREPWRSAAALCWEVGLDWREPSVEGLELVRHAWERGLNSPLSSAAGRVWDAAAALITGIHHTSFEGQGPMLLETLADACDQVVELPMATVAGVLRVDWSPLLPVLRDATLSLPQRAAVFHNSMAEVIVRQALVLREQYPFDGVGLTGGVFQNRRLSEQVVDKLGALGMATYLPARVPCNDGGLSYGQVIEATIMVVK
jgi:hydrogenase maturation protein HypF